MYSGQPLCDECYDQDKVRHSTLLYHRLLRFARVPALDFDGGTAAGLGFGWASSGLSALSGALIMSSSSACSGSSGCVSAASRASGMHTSALSHRCRFSKHLPGTALHATQSSVLSVTGPQINVSGTYEKSSNCRVSETPLGLCSHHTSFMAPVACCQRTHCAKLEQHRGHEPHPSQPVRGSQPDHGPRHCLLSAPLIHRAQ